MLRTYKYLLRPKDEQTKQLDFLLWQSRLVYNLALAQRITTYRETGKGIGYRGQWSHFRDMRRENPESLGQINSSSLQHMLRRLDKTFQAFFRRVKVSETPGFPRFKGHNRFKSMEFTYGDGCKLRQKEQGRMCFYIQNVGEIRICYHRPLPKGAVLKHVVIKLVNSRWYICLMLEIPEQTRVHQGTGHQVGIDMGLNSLLALSTGELIGNPRLLENNLQKIRRLQRHVSRQKKGSHRQKQTYTKISDLHEKITNQRKDSLHKIANQLVKDYDLIAIEDLKLKFMIQNQHMSRSSHDAGLGELRQLLEYKAEEAGVQV
jgi:putative transposase